MAKLNRKISMKNRKIIGRLFALGFENVAGISSRATGSKKSKFNQAEEVAPSFHSRFYRAGQQ